MARYDRCPQEVFDLGARIAEQFHGPTLHDTQVDIVYQFVYAARDKEGQLKGPAIKFCGWPADSNIKIKSTVDRCAGSGDVIVQIDGDQWNDPENPWSDAKKEEVIDSALCRIELVLSDPDENGNCNPESDDLGRPKLKIRDFEMMVCGFPETIRRHGQLAKLSVDGNNFVEEFAKYA